VQETRVGHSPKGSASAARVLGAHRHWQQAAAVRQQAAATSDACVVSWPAADMRPLHMSWGVCCFTHCCNRSQRRALCRAATEAGFDTDFVPCAHLSWWWFCACLHCL
jgi:hypothetical protein